MERTPDALQRTGAPLSPGALADLALAREEMPPLALYFSLRGRIARRRFWLHGVLALLILGLAGVGLLRIAGLSADLAEKIVNLTLLWPVVAISAKRWHDIGRPAWFALINLIPAVGWLIALVGNGFLRGTPGPNRYGPAQ